MHVRIGAQMWAVVTLGVAAIVVGAGLLVAGLDRIELRTFVLRTQTAGVVATVKPGAQVCEGPVRTPYRAPFVVIYGERDGNPQVKVIVRLVGGRLVAAGVLRPGSAVARLDHSIPSDRPVRICVASRGGELGLLGGANGNQVSPRFTTTRVAQGQVFALLLERPSSLLGALGIAFSRAAIFRPSWIGPWTFWVLCGLLLASVGIVGFGLWDAAREDDPSRNGG